MKFGSHNFIERMWVLWNLSPIKQKENTNPNRKLNLGWDSSPENHCQSGQEGWKFKDQGFVAWALRIVLLTLNGYCIWRNTEKKTRVDKAMPVRARAGFPDNLTKKFLWLPYHARPVSVWQIHRKRMSPSPCQTPTSAPEIHLLR